MSREPQTALGRAALERRVAAIIERQIGVTSKRLSSPVRPSVKSGPRGQQSQAVALRAAAIRERNETLRVSSPSGEICAAVSVTSRLAVTALHCARSLCESTQTLAPPALNQCTIRYEIPSGMQGAAKVVATSENDLLALLELSQPLPKYGGLRCDDPRTNDRVYTVSHPGGVTWQLAYGRLTQGPIPLEWVDGEATRVLVAEIDTNYGSSGGGLFDVQDQVVGIQIARWSQWTTDYGKAAFIQATRVFAFVGRYCLARGSSACVGLRCASKAYDIWSFGADD
jgi:S1-C subfamily serine protease